MGKEISKTQGLSKQHRYNLYKKQQDKKCLRSIIHNYETYIQHIGYPKGKGLHLYEKLAILLLRRSITADVITGVWSNYLTKEVSEYFKNNILSQEPNSITKERLTRFLESYDYNMFDMSIIKHLGNINNIGNINNVTGKTVGRVFVVENMLKHLHKFCDGNYTIGPRKPKEEKIIDLEEESIREPEVKKLNKIMRRYYQEFNLMQKEYWKKQNTFLQRLWNSNKNKSYDEKKDLFADLINRIVEVTVNNLNASGKSISVAMQRADIDTLQARDLAEMIVYPLNYLFKRTAIKGDIVDNNPQAVAIFK